MTRRTFTSLALLATILALMVAAVGAYVRLSSAGIDCTDGPGCSARIDASRTGQESDDASNALADRTIEAPRIGARTLHLYLGAALAALIVAVAIGAWRRRAYPGPGPALPLLVAGLTGAQVALGAWWLSSLERPMAVTAHLLAGGVIAALLWWITLRSSGMFSGFERPLLSVRAPGLRPWVLGAVVLAAAQLVVGGWASANDAALGCPDFPLCGGKLVPELDLVGAFASWHRSAADGVTSVLSSEARATIQFAHRVGALVLLLYVGVLGHAMTRRDHEPRIRVAGGAVLVLLVLELGLGVGIAMLGRPVPLAVAHSAMAILLLLSLTTAYHILKPPRAAV